MPTKNDEFDELNKRSVESFTGEARRAGADSDTGLSGTARKKSKDSVGKEGSEQKAGKTGKNPSRLAEMTAVLRRNKITQGMTPEKLRCILEELGPTYIKLGQIMSLHSDILPKEYCDELMKLNSEVTPMPFETVKEVIEDSYGMAWNEIFEQIDETPLGSASIAQVHRAKLHTGEDVIVKVQRKGVYELMSRDISLLKRAAHLMPIRSIKNIVDPEMVLGELWSTAQEEMDFLKEASNMEEFARDNADIRYVDCPKLFREYTTAKVLVMEYIDGFSIDDMDALRAGGYDPEEVGRKYVNSFIKQVMEDGFFHADPHPGNVKIRGGKIVWIDMGMMGRLNDKERRIMVRGVEGIARHDIPEIVSAILEFGSYRGKPDRAKLYTDIRDFLDGFGGMSMGDVDVPEVMQTLLDIMKKNHIALPHGVTMLVRGMTHVEGVLTVISPDVNMIEIATGRELERKMEDFDWREELERNGRKLYRSASKGVEIPSLTADLLKDMLNGRAEANVNMQASENFSELLFSAVRNLVIGICEAALLLSSSLICTTQMQPRILGIPALGFFGYLASLGIAAFFSLRHIIRKRRKR